MTGPEMEALVIIAVAFVGLLAVYRACEWLLDRLLERLRDPLPDGTHRWDDDITYGKEDTP